MYKIKHVCFFSFGRKTDFCFMRLDKIILCFESKRIFETEYISDNSLESCFELRKSLLIKTFMCMCVFVIYMAWKFIWHTIVFTLVILINFTKKRYNLCDLKIYWSFLIVWIWKELNNLKYLSKKERNEVDITRCRKWMVFSDTRSLFRSVFYQVRVPLFFIHSTAVSATVQCRWTPVMRASGSVHALLWYMYNSRTKSPTTRPSGADQFESTFRRFANFIKNQCDYLFKTFDIRWSVRVNDRKHRRTSQYFGVGAACELR